ncbi:MAG: phosphate-starvation-inducible PsiE family protein [Acidobacteriota bacterium]|nr:phosphate-starvation-inducible PsiE family protein [Acidobacteriota bacterium]MDE3092769.1 phosphate-starvation-inducible PsiE family protein [Acidobacteriota bacterium]
MNSRTSPEPATPSLDRIVQGLLATLEYAIIVSLLIVAAAVLGRTVYTFFQQWSSFPETVVAAIDGVLVVVILLDIAHTVLAHLRSSSFPVRPFLVIGILAGVRDILSASARLTFGSTLQGVNFDHALISLALGVGVVVMLSASLLLMRFSQRRP